MTSKIQTPTFWFSIYLVILLLLGELLGPASAQTLTLTVVKSGGGTGTVISSPAGINCGATCSADFPPLTVVRLTAIPDSGSGFGGWYNAYFNPYLVATTTDIQISVDVFYNKWLARFWSFVRPASVDLAFSSFRDGNWELYGMNKDGSNQINISDNLAFDADPAYSPDGNSIVFASSRDCLSKLYIVQSDGSVSRLPAGFSIAPDGSVFCEPDVLRTPKFSPDGTKIVFRSNLVPGGPPANTQIYVMDSDGTNIINLSNNSHNDQDPAFTPDGKKIVFASDQDGDYEIYVMNSDGSNRTRLTFAPGDDDVPEVSPDGSRITFTSARDGNFQVYIMNVDGSGQTNLTRTSADDGDSVFSPDGNQIAFVSNRDGNYEIYLMNGDGTNPARLTNTSANELQPFFNPNPLANRPPSLSLSPPSADFGIVNVGSTKNLPFTVQNTGGGTLTGSASTSAPFSIVGSNSFNLAAKQTTDITVRFSPTSEATFNGNVSFTSNGGNASPTVTGTGIALPRIDSLSAVSGAVGSPLLINGSDFGASQGTGSLRFCSTALEVFHWENSLIAVLVPQLPTGTLCAVQVSTSAGLSNSLNFSVTSAATISGFLKTSANRVINGAQIFITVGTAGLVTSNSKGFYSKSGLVNGQYTVEPRFSGYQFTPEQRVVTISGASVSNVNFIGAPVLPVIKSLTSKTTKGKVTVTISGSGFGSAASDVMFGTVKAAVTSWKNTTIVAVPPPGTGCVLVTVVTATGTSNTKPFNCSPPSGATNVMLLPSGDFGVLIFTQLQTISSDATMVVADITIENITGTWYVVHPGIVGGVTGSDLPTGDFMIGPFEQRSLGRVTFPKTSQLLLFADNSIDLGSCSALCDLQTRKILGALALELLWRAVLGSAFPVSERDVITLLVGLQLNSPLVALGAHIFDVNIIGIVNDIPKVANDPIVKALLVKYGFTGTLPSWFTLYARAALEARILIETLIYPHTGQLVFDAR